MLRAELDGLDDGLHDLLMRRAQVVARVAALRVKGAVPMRPGREAAIIRRLLARHQGPLPAQAVVRIWRELLAATTAMQGATLISVCEADPASGGPAGAMTGIAREHFGALTRMHVHRTPSQALRELAAGTASAAVLPFPGDADPAGTWWTALLHREEPRIHIVARLPFWLPRPDGAPQADALVATAAAPDPSGADRSLIGLEIEGEVSRTRLTAALAAAGLPPSTMILRRVAGAPVQLLIETEGFVAEGDARLAALGPIAARPVLLGAYAIPVGPAAGEERR